MNVVAVVMAVSCLDCYRYSNPNHVGGEIQDLLDNIPPTNYLETNLIIPRKPNKYLVLIYLKVVKKSRTKTMKKKILENDL